MKSLQAAFSRRLQQLSWPQRVLVIGCVVAALPLLIALLLALPFVVGLVWLIDTQAEAERK